MSKFYDHPDASIWDNIDTHAQLISTLEADYDGWAYSLTSTLLQQILPIAPEGIRVAAWVKPFCSFKKNVRIAYSWEPVLFKPARFSSGEGVPFGRDHLSEGITLQRGLTGAKPARFNRWVLDLLGYVDGDEFIDLFPGTGGMERERAQQVLL
jgi:hypothetical protein